MTGAEPFQTILYDKKNFKFVFNLYPPNMLEIMYLNRRTHRKRIYHVYYDDQVIDLKVLEEALELTEQILSRIIMGSDKPNIPLYAILYILYLRINGFSYKCKIKPEKCPVKVYRVINNREVAMSIKSLTEQMFRMVRRFLHKKTEIELGLVDTYLRRR